MDPMREALEILKNLSALTKQEVDQIEKLPIVNIFKYRQDLRNPTAIVSYLRFPRNTTPAVRPENKPELIKIENRSVFYGSPSKNGPGILVYIDGSIYEGNFSNSIVNGPGRKILSNGTVYVGDWVNGKIISGMIISPSDKSVYNGDIKDRPHGEGAEIHINGTYYSGSYLNGRRHGNGRLEYPDGTVYNGEFRYGKLEGEGTAVYANGDCYKGTWANNKQNGNGEFIYASDRQKYIGGFVNGAKHGYGQLIYPDGRTIEGNWNKGKYTDNNIPEKNIELDTKGSKIIRRKSFGTTGLRHSQEEYKMRYSQPCVYPSDFSRSSLDSSSDKYFTEEQKIDEDSSNLSGKHKFFSKSQDLEDKASLEKSKTQDVPKSMVNSKEPLPSRIPGNDAEMEIPQNSSYPYAPVSTSNSKVPVNDFGPHSSIPPSDRNCVPKITTPVSIPIVPPSELPIINSNGQIPSAMIPHSSTESNLPSADMHSNTKIPRLPLHSSNPEDTYSKEITEALSDQSAPSLNVHLPVFNAQALPINEILNDLSEVQNFEYFIHFKPYIDYYPKFDYSQTNYAYRFQFQWKTLERDSIYKGEMNSEGQPHGLGILISKRFLYQGSWANGQKQGLGRQFGYRGDMHFGYWSRGMRHGFGMCNEGTTYAGDWRDDFAHGLGYCENGNTKYNGEWCKGILHGNVIISHPEGSIEKAHYNNGETF